MLVHMLTDRPVASAPEVATQAILVVEDEALIRITVGDVLRDHGYEVIEAANGDEALALLHGGGLRIDLVFSDVRMPGSVDGFALARWVRANMPVIPVLLTSGYVGRTALASDLSDYGTLLTKPYDHRELLQRIAAMLPPAD